MSAEAPQTTATASSAPQDTAAAPDRARPAAATAAAAAVAPPPSLAALTAFSEPVPKIELRTRKGNPPEYSVLGQTYRLLPGVSGYKERGVASWYGPDFHAKSTSNGEAYDMYAMTAAHRTLPIPAYVRVTNLTNGRAIIVRVNDRGPFKHNRIIDLSYTAALKLDMLRQGTALVEVESVLAAGDDGVLPGLPVQLAKLDTGREASGSLFAQVGAFGVEPNALALRDHLLAAGVTGVLIVSVQRAGKPLWRVRIGPIGSVEQYDTLVTQLEHLGHSAVTLARTAD
jgi:rare lipoprotein A